MTRVGLSPALGTFVAGVVLANSEYRHELESDIEPFKGLLLGLFFIAVGASIDFGLVGERAPLVSGLVAGLVAVKFLVLLALGRAFRMRLDQNLLFGLALAQGGEFCFVLLSFAVQNAILDGTTANVLVATVRCRWRRRRCSCWRTRSSCSRASASRLAPCATPTRSTSRAR